MGPLDPKLDALTTQPRINIHFYFSYRSNCDSAAANTLRQHYQRPYFLSQDMESSKTDWIFMGTPGYGAHIHVRKTKFLFRKKY